MNHEHLCAENVSYLIRGKALVSSASLVVKPGRVTVIAGANGAGKSTLLAMLAGDLPATSGEVRLHRERLSLWDSEALARQRSMLTQKPTLNYSFSAEEVVCMGRAPWHGFETRIELKSVTAEVMCLMGVTDLAQRDYLSLSGGEQQRVQLARVLAQIWTPTRQNLAQYLLLDEPTTGLDVLHQQIIMRAVKRFAQDGGAVLMVLHDLNLAASYADHLVLMKSGCVITQGNVDEVVKTEVLQQTFGIETFVYPHPMNGRPAVLFSE